MSHATTSIHDGRCTGQLRLATPLGEMLLARTAGGLAGAWFAGQKHHPGPIDAPERPADPLLQQAADQLERYFTGRATSFDLPLDLLGTSFERSVWAELLRLDRGTTASYGAIATRLGRPTASRAVGGAVGRNPVSIVVPCHRVVGSAGAMTGYAGGVDRKTALLRLEAAGRSPDSGLLARATPARGGAVAA